MHGREERLHALAGCNFVPPDGFAALLKSDNTIRLVPQKLTSTYLNERRIDGMLD
jgi:hypothetical protein